ncbi:hypothetical protein HOB30_03485 [Candidatus Falkowbacteria bacterium]|nr:hypothetical protein [Candidatus Falkowbacteria bacterium]
MKSFIKIFAMIVLFFCCLQFFSLITINTAVAADVRDITVKLNVPINGLEGFDPIQEGDCVGGTLQKSDNKVSCYYVPWLAQYIDALYRYSVILGSVIAVTIMIVAGGMYMMSGLNAALRDKAKKMMGGAILGLVLLLGSYAVLTIVNPDLTKLEAISIEKVKEKKVLAPPELCYQIAEDTDYKKYFTAKGWSNTSACGEAHAIVLREQGEAEIKLDENAKCYGSKCEVDKVCVKQSSVSNVYQCISAYTGGIVKPITDPKAAKEYYLMKLYLIKAGTNTGQQIGTVYETNSDQQKQVPYNYSIARLATDAGFSDSDRFYFYAKVHENYADNDEYFLDAAGNVISVAYKDGEVNCWTYKNSTKFKTRGYIQNDCQWIRGRDLRGKTINLNLRNTVTYYDPIGDSIEDEIAEGILGLSSWHPFGDLYFGKTYQGSSVQYDRHRNVTLNLKEINRD